MMQVSKLHFNGFNPELRINKKSPKYRRLLKSMRQHGQLSAILVSLDGLVIDGHRRLSCAIDLGMTEVLVDIISSNAQETWVECVTNQQGFNGRQVIQATAQGLNAIYLPKDLATAVVDLQELAGEDLYAEMAKSGISPHVRNAVAKVCRYTGDNSPEWRSMVLRWIVRHNMQKKIRDAIESDPLGEEGGRERMRSAINRDAPLRALGYG